MNSNSKAMKTILSLIAIVLIIPMVIISSIRGPLDVGTAIEHVIGDTKAEQSDRNAFSIHQFPARAGESLEVRTSGGSITVRGDDVNEATVKMYVQQNRRYLSPSDTDLGNFEINIEKRGNKIIASAKRTGNTTNILTGRVNQSISFDVTVPKEFLVDVSTSGGSIKLTNLVGEIQGRTSGGSLTLEQLEGNLDVRTSGGSITLRDSHGNIHARTSGGSVTATGSSGSIRLSTSGGSMTLTDLSGEVDASTSGGSIRANILNLTGDISLRTSGGSITAGIPSNIGIDLDLRGNSVNVPLNNFSGESRRNSIVGKMNGGGHNVTMRTSGGSVRVNWN